MKIVRVDREEVKKGLERSKEYIVSDLILYSREEDASLDSSLFSVSLFLSLFLCNL